MQNTGRTPVALLAQHGGDFPLCLRPIAVRTPLKAIAFGDEISSDFHHAVAFIRSWFVAFVCRGWLASACCGLLGRSFLRGCWRRCLFGCHCGCSRFLHSRCCCLLGRCGCCCLFGCGRCHLLGYCGCGRFFHCCWCRRFLCYRFCFLLRHRCPLIFTVNQTPCALHRPSKPITRTAKSFYPISGLFQQQLTRPASPTTSRSASRMKPAARLPPSGLPIPGRDHARPQ